jgi:hypothetical protein
MIVTFRHALTIPGFSKRRGFCRNGMRTWFERNGLDYADFKRNGIPEEKLLAVGDAFAIATVQWAHECAAREVC